MSRPATVITLSETEHAELMRRIKLRKGAQDACLRAEIILACASGESGNDIAKRLGTLVNRAVVIVPEHPICQFSRTHSFPPI